MVISPVATQLVQTMREEPGRNLENLPVVLALSRALQEQYFQWQEKLKPDLAGRSQTRFSRAGRRRQRPCWQRLSASISTTACTLGFGPDLGEMGNCLRKRSDPIFRNCYSKNWHFLIAKEVNLLNGLMQPKVGLGSMPSFADPPFSTSQILHPEKYYVKRENPLAIRTSQAWRGK